MTAEPGLNAFRGARALVFGATGFIGIHVARALARRGAHVTLAARDPGAASPLLSELGPTAGMVTCDVLTEGAALEAVRRTAPHITFNLVGYGVDRRERDEALARRLNGEFPAELAAAVGAGRAEGWSGSAIVHAGTQAEYGPLKVLREDAEPRPDTQYGRTKLEGSSGLLRSAAAHGMPVTVARVFTVYGPGELPGRLLPSLIEASIRGGDLPLTKGTQRTDFVHVEDVAEGLVRLGAVDAEAGAIVNLATGKLTSVREFALAAAAQLGIARERLRFGKLPQRPDTMRYHEVSTERLHALTGWLPALGLEAGIQRTLEYYGIIDVEE